MASSKGFLIYKSFWEEQASYMDQPPWFNGIILKLVLSNDFEINFEELSFSDHAITKENKKIILRLKVPYNYLELDNFMAKSLKLLGIEEKWLINSTYETSLCTNHLKRQK